MFNTDIYITKSLYLLVHEKLDTPSLPIIYSMHSYSLTWVISIHEENVSSAVNHTLSHSTPGLWDGGMGGIILA